MKLEIIGFTRSGSRLCARLTEEFRVQGEKCCGYVRPRFLEELQQEAGETANRSVESCECSLETWTKQHFSQADGLIYIGAAGIAVRAIAPFLKDKLTDPAVVAIDEQGRYAVSLLSGHVGGANNLARRAAEILGAEPVITTASDRQGLTAIDEWAKERSLMLSDRTAAAQVAAALVNGEQVGFFSQDFDRWQTPDGYEENKLCRCNVWVTWKMGALSAAEKATDRVTLRLIPKVLTLGIGCRKGISETAVLKAVKQVFSEYRLDMRAILRIATIDLKKEEPGLLQAVKDLEAEFVTFSPEQLRNAEGDFSRSEFVREITGVDNVCERAAVMGAGGGRILVGKQICEGVTVAVAL